MEGTACGVVSAEDAVVHRSVVSGTAGHTALIIECEEDPACRIITEPAAVDGGDELYALLHDLQGHEGDS